MKRILAVLMTLAMLLPLAACGGGSSLAPAGTEAETLIQATGETKTEAPIAGKHDVTGFCAGFGRGDITPETSVPLAGYGATSYRMSNNVLDPLYATCIALQDEDGERMLIYQFDLITCKQAFSEQIVKLVTKATGVKEDHILLNATHTHSGPDVGSSEGGIAVWKAKAYQAIVKAAEDAIADLDSCKVYTGVAETENLNFVRRVVLEHGYSSPHGTLGSGEIIGFETEIDSDIRYVKFERANQKDLIIANWQCHPTMTGGAEKYDISSDFVGQFRKNVEEELGVGFLYLQGGAGNVAATTSWKSIPQPATTYTVKGKMLCEALVKGLADATETPAGKIRAKKDILVGTYTHEDEDKLAAATEVVALFNANKRNEAEAMALANGLSSKFEAKAIVTRTTRGATGEIPLFAFAFGDVAIVTAPFEMFCDTYRDLRGVSPFGFTLTCGYSYEGQGYMPAAEDWPHKGYEVVTCIYVQGTAEQITAKQLEMLNELKAK